MIFSLNWYLATFAGRYLYIYPVISILVILLYLFVKRKWKNEIVNWLYVFNTILVWLTLINLITYATELFIAWYGQNPYEWYAFSDNRANIFSSYGWSFWLMMAFNLLLPQLFWFKKLRKSIVFTFIVILFLNLGTWFERLVIYITSAYRDYLPSSWSTYHGSTYFIQIMLSLLYFIVTTFIVYWLFHKRKKLPFPSAILSYSLFFISYSLFHCIHHFN